MSYHVEPVDTVQTSIQHMRRPFAYCVFDRGWLHDFIVYELFSDVCFDCRSSLVGVHLRHLPLERHLGPLPEAYGMYFFRHERASLSNDLFDSTSKIYKKMMSMLKEMAL
jgi:hypothetical protein